MIDLRHIDCREYLATGEDNSFELAIVDPPYGVKLTMQKFVKPSRPNSYATPPQHKGFNDKEIPSQKYFEQLKRVSKHQIVWGAQYMCKRLEISGAWIFWDKNNGQGSHFADGELAHTSFSCSLKRVTLHPFDGTRGGKDRIHPTQKPVKLYEWLLMNYAKGGDRILDTHLGSGSIAIACHNLGFDLVGCELDEDYYNAACERLDKHKRHLRMF